MKRMHLLLPLVSKHYEKRAKKRFTHLKLRTSSKSLQSVMIISRPFTFISNAYFFQAYMLLLTSTVIVARQHLAGNTNRPTSQARNTKKENSLSNWRT